MLEAPAGYKLQLTKGGQYSTSTHSYDDYLTVYDNNEASGTKLVDQVYDTGSISSDKLSSGRYMTIYFHSDGDFYNAAGIDLAITVKKPLSSTDITVAAIDDQTWTGMTIQPTVTVQDGTTDITDQCDINYTNNTNTGTATVTITAKSTSAYYHGSTSTTFKIVPKPVTDSNIANTGSTPTIALTQDQNGITATLNGASDGNVSITGDVAVNDVKLDRTFEAGKKVAICLPFAVTAAKAATLGLGKFYQFNGINAAGKIEMQEVTGDLAANTPYIFEPSADITTAIDFGAQTLKAGGPASVGSGYTFKGIYNRVKWTTDTSDPLYDATLAGELGHTYSFALQDLAGYSIGQFAKLASGAHSRPFRAYLLYDGTWDGNQPSFPSSNARTRGGEALPDVIDIVWLGANGGETGIAHTEITEITEKADAWYTLDGRKLNGKPSTKGLYINNGRKVVIK